MEVFLRRYDANYRIFDFVGFWQAFDRLCRDPGALFLRRSYKASKRIDVDLTKTVQPSSSFRNDPYRGLARLGMVSLISFGRRLCHGFAASVIGSITTEMMAAVGLQAASGDITRMVGKMSTAW